MLFECVRRSAPVQGFWADAESQIASRVGLGSLSHSAPQVGPLLMVAISEVHVHLQIFITA